MAADGLVKFGKHLKPVRHIPAHSTAVFRSPSNFDRKMPHDKPYNRVRDNRKHHKDMDQKQLRKENVQPDHKQIISPEPSYETDAPRHPPPECRFRVRTSSTPRNHRDSASPETSAGRYRRLLTCLFSNTQGGIGIDRSLSDSA